MVDAPSEEEKAAADNTTTNTMVVVVRRGGGEEKRDSSSSIVAAAIERPTLKKRGSVGVRLSPRVGSDYQIEGLPDCEESHNAEKRVRTARKAKVGTTSSSPSTASDAGADAALVWSASKDWKPKDKTNYDLLLRQCRILEQRREGFEWHNTSGKEAWPS
jgi:hypothetical protein